MKDIALLRDTYVFHYFAVMFIYLQEFPVDMKKIGRDGVQTFVQSMLQSAEEKREVKPQTRHDNVNPAEIEQLMANLKKGLVRKG